MVALIKQNWCSGDVHSTRIRSFFVCLVIQVLEIIINQFKRNQYALEIHRFKNRMPACSQTGNSKKDKYWTEVRRQKKNI